MILGETLSSLCTLQALTGCVLWCIECNDPFLSSAGDMTNVVQRADLGLNLELQLLILDLDVSTT